MATESTNMDNNTQADAQGGRLVPHAQHVDARNISVASAHPIESSFASRFLATPGYNINQPWIFEMLYASLLMMCYLHDAIQARDVLNQHPAIRAASNWERVKKSFVNGFIAFLIAQIMHEGDYNHRAYATKKSISNHVSQSGPFKRFVVSQLLQWAGEIFPGVYNHVTACHTDTARRFYYRAQNMVDNGIYSLPGLVCVS